jgi:Protein of unknown function (DUF2817)
MNGDHFFSPDYRTARARFRSAATARGFRLETHPIDEADDLTIDVAIVGDENLSRLVVVSSGLHGVEGFLGSAIQTAILEDQTDRWALPSGSGLVLMHSLDPFGFAHIRRGDAGNVDLNRNFLLDGESYSGSPPTYREIDWLINPKRPPRRIDLLMIESLPAILRHGKTKLKRAIAGGQYDFPLGLFFGGHGPSTTRRLLEEQMPRWIGGAEHVIHLDIHTGLGPWGNLALLLEDCVTADRARWLADHFGRERVEWWDGPTSYPTRGGLGAWCQSTFADRAYDFLCAEFGTDSGSRVLAALRAENQAQHWGKPGDPATLRAKRRLVEAFAPADPAWREGTVSQGLATVRRAFEVGFRTEVVA